jgi:hypothetical protein
MLQVQFVLFTGDSKWVIALNMLSAFIIGLRPELVQINSWSIDNNVR